MGNTRNTFRTVLNILGGTALAAGLAACAAGQPETGGSAAPAPSLTPTASAGATATPTPDPVTDPAAAAAWAAGVVPAGGSDGFILAQNGHFEAGTPGAFTVQLATLPAGGYSVYFACRGDAGTTVTLAVAGDDAATLSGGCAGESTGMDVNTTAEGVTLEVAGESGEAVDWALAITDLLPRTEG